MSDVLRLYETLKNVTPLSALREANTLANTLRRDHADLSPEVLAEGLTLLNAFVMRGQDVGWENEIANTLRHYLSLRGTMESTAGINLKPMCLDLAQTYMMLHELLGMIAPDVYVEAAKSKFERAFGNGENP